MGFISKIPQNPSISFIVFSTFCRSGIIYPRPFHPSAKADGKFEYRILNIENFLTGDKPEFNNIAVCFSRRIEMLAQNESRQKNSPFTRGCEKMMMQM
jgi:hypothetical protein